MCFANCGYSSVQNVFPFYLDYLLNIGSFGEFSKILQIPNKDLVDPSQRKSITAFQFFYNGLKYHDILLRPGQLLSDCKDKDFNGIVKYSLIKWTNGTVPYYISQAFSSSFTIDEREYIDNEIFETNRLLGPNVVFRPYQFGDTDYVYIFKGGSGYFSNLGKVGGPQVISLTPPLRDGYLTHEMQHTLGFGHEHNRIDRDNYIKLNTENISEVLKCQYMKFTSDNLTNAYPYGYYSIMHFTQKSAGFNLTVFNVLQKDIDRNIIGKKFTLKPSDIQKVKSEYPLLI